MTRAEQAALRYRNRLAEGLCGNCGVRPREGDTTACKECRAARRRWTWINRDQERAEQRASNLYSREERRKASTARYRSLHGARARDATTRSNRKLRADVIEAYGGVCTCCGEWRFEFLTLDHINHDGAAHRREIGTGLRAYSWAKQNGYPDTLRILCMNCNWARGKYGQCPHEREEDNDEVRQASEDISPRNSAFLGLDGRASFAASAK